MSYKFSSRLSSSPKVMSLHNHTSSYDLNNNSSNTRTTANITPGAIRIKQKGIRSGINNIRVHDSDRYSDSSDSTTCSELSNLSNGKSLKSSVQSYGRGINNTTPTKRTSISMKRSSSTSTADRPPIPNINIKKNISIDTNYEVIATSPSSSEKKMHSITINDQVNDRALRKILDLEILNESLRSINESLECTIKEQSLKMEQLQLQIDHLKTASTLNDNTLLLDTLLIADDTNKSTSEIKIIPRHPQRTNSTNLSKHLSSSIPNPEENKTNIPEENNEDNIIDSNDVQYNRICAKLKFLINDASKAISLQPIEIEKALSKNNPNEIKIEKRNSVNQSFDSTTEKGLKTFDSSSTLNNEDLTSNDFIENNENLKTSKILRDEIFKIDEEIIEEKTDNEENKEKNTKLDQDTKNKSENNNTNSNPSNNNNKNETISYEAYQKMMNIVKELSKISENVVNETSKLELNEKNNENSTSNTNEISEKNKPTANEQSSIKNKGLAMLLNPVINNPTSFPNSTNNKIKELSITMNNMIGNLNSILKEENAINDSGSSDNTNNIRRPIILSNVAIHNKGNTSDPNGGSIRIATRERNNSNVSFSSASSKTFSRVSSVEYGISMSANPNIGSSGNASGNNNNNNRNDKTGENISKFNSSLLANGSSNNNNGNGNINTPGLSSILANIPFKKNSNLFYRTRTWDPEYCLNHFRSLSVQNTSNIRLTNAINNYHNNTSNNNQNHDNHTSNSNSNSNNNSNNNSNSNNNTNSNSNNKNGNSSSNHKINSKGNFSENGVHGLERRRSHLPSFYL